MIEKSQISDSAVNQKLFSFYLKYAKPKFKTWSLKNSVVSLKAPVPADDFVNNQFKGFQRENDIVDEFTLADLPCMKPYDWIFLFNIILKDEKKYEAIIAHFRRMFICYI